MAARNYKAEIDSAKQSADDLRDVLQQMYRDMEDAPAAKKTGFLPGIKFATRDLEDFQQAIRGLNREMKEVATWQKATDKEELARKKDLLESLKAIEAVDAKREEAAKIFRANPIANLLGIPQAKSAIGGAGKALADSNVGQTAIGGGKEILGAAAFIGGPWVQAAKLGKDAMLSLANSANTLQIAFSPITELVQHIDPSLVERFQMALDDLRAAIGQGLRPALDGAIVVAQTLNALFTDLAPTITPIIQQLTDVFKELAVEIIAEAKPAIEAYLVYLRELLNQGLPLLKDFMPLLREVVGIYIVYVSALTDIAHVVLPYFASALRATVGTLTELTISLRNLIQDRSASSVLQLWRDPLNLFGPSRTGQAPTTPIDPNRRTIAARQGQETTVEQIGEQTRIAAFSGATLGERQLQTQEQIRNQIAQLLNRAWGIPIADTAN